MANLTDLFSHNFSTSTTAYTLGMRTQVPDENSNLQELFVLLGRVQSFNPTQARAVERIWEINTASGGEAVEIVPGAITDQTVALDRIDVYPIPFLIAFGATESNNLRSQTIPFTLVEWIFDPKDIRKSRQIEYVNCYLSDFSDPIDINTPFVTASGTVNVSFSREGLLFGALNQGGGTVEPTALKSLDWLSFKKSPTSSAAAVPTEKLKDRGLTSDFTLLNQAQIAGLANVCVELETT